MKNLTCFVRLDDLFLNLNLITSIEKNEDHTAYVHFSASENVVHLNIEQMDFLEAVLDPIHAHHHNVDTQQW